VPKREINILEDNSIYLQSGRDRGLLQRKSMTINAEEKYDC